MVLPLLLQLLKLYENKELCSVYSAWSGFYKLNNGFVLDLAFGLNTQAKKFSFITQKF